MNRPRILTENEWILAILFLLFASFAYAQDPFARIVFDSEKVMASRGVAWGDFDGDGYPDIYITNGVVGYKQVNFLYHNNGDGTFTRVTSGPPVEDSYVTNGCSWGDFDNDGDLDLYVAANIGSYDDPVINNCLYENNGDGTFTKNTTAGPAVNDREYTCAAGWGDYNNDGFIDLFIKNGSYPKTPNSLYRNNGNGSFADITGIPLVSNENATLVSRFAWGDYDNDGDLDIAIAGGDQTNNVIWRNDGNNVFTKLLNGSGISIIEGSFSSACCWGDYDNDGDLDLFFSNYGKSAPEVNFLYRNDGNDVFTKIAEGPVANDNTCSLACSWGDIDNDGDLDLFVGNDIYYKNALYMNNGDGTFTKDSTSVVVDSSFTYSSTFADYNKDGFIDLFTTREGKNILFKNIGPENGNTNHWIDIQCVGTTSNRAGIGAKVRVKATINAQPRWQMREISAQNGYGGHDDLRAHFGLADATIIPELRVEWPSGIVQTLTNVAVDQFLTLTEPSGGDQILVTAPNGAEDWQIGSNQSITWTSSGNSGTVILEYSTDNGMNWQEIAASEIDDGEFSWLVPETPSQNCLVRVIDSDGSALDVSDNVFSITELEFITISTPNGGENWEVGSSQNITWSSANTSGTVSIEYTTDGGANWQTIATLPDTGAFAWLIPDQSSANCLIKVADVDGSPNDQSDQVFAIVKQYFDISGTVVYDGTGRTVADVTIDLSQSLVTSKDTTSVDGSYLLQHIPADTAMVKPSKQGDLKDAISGSDVLLILQYLAFMIDMTHDQQFAADVTEDGSVSGSDAQALLRYLAFYDDNTGITGEWRFDPTDTTFNLEQNTTANFTAYLKGDANLSWGESANMAKVQASNVSLDILGPNFAGIKEIIIPVRLTLVGEKVNTLAFSLSYNANILEYKATESTALSQDFMIASNGGESGLVHIAMASAKGVNGSGEILHLVFKSRTLQSRSTEVQAGMEIIRAQANDLAITPDRANLNNSGNGNWAVTPDRFSLEQNYPNPFNPSTSIGYQVPVASQVKLSIYSMRGDQICILVNERKEAGLHQVMWTGRDASGKAVPSGIYVIRMEAGTFNMNRKMVKVQ